MEETQRKQIETLRHEGLGYKRIAKELNISVNTVKSFCRQNDLTGVMVERTKSVTNNIPDEVKQLKQAEMDYRLSKVMVDYLCHEGLITKREEKLITTRLVKQLNPLLGILEESHG
ncbi:helix-turn-helix domain-containing protein [Lactococcus insecticola]|uniref:Transposase IS30-like HTH domain-containing protein n=1 Tax=Pseudolactococcus insecticola TaxID=2709158 RepID=A0A6A0B7G5_9LACT|nr:helix-turn-helix domain-containing protein [Lactococcus insecticola]GFH40274.1 hypothetical protein Hs20B_06720 [Lactococcus insecticola]